jgi:hypothetical protein
MDLNVNLPKHVGKQLMYLHEKERQIDRQKEGDSTAPFILLKGWVLDPKKG